MRRMILTAGRWALAVLLAAFIGAPLGFAQEMDPEAIQKAYQEARMVTEFHDLLQKMAGTWKTTSKMWEDPNGEPTITEGKNVGVMVMGGRYVETHYESTYNGMPMHGMGLLGYDNLKQEYAGVWLDNMSTGMMPYAGKYDPDKRTLICYGTYLDVVTKKDQTWRMETTFLSDDKHVFAMFGPGPGGNEVRWMEIAYERQ